MTLAIQNVLAGRKHGHPFYFPQGLPGLDSHFTFYVETMPDNRFFCLLQAVEDEDVGIILVDPFPFFPDYDVDLLDTDRREIKLQREEDLLILTTVTVGDDKLYTNLAAPILINLTEKRGRQIILPQRTEQMREPLS